MTGPVVDAQPGRSLVTTSAAHEFIERHTAAGDHVVARTLRSAALLHPDEPQGCAYTGRRILEPSREVGAYVAEIRADGVIVPREHAAWQDVARFIDPARFRERNAE